MIPNDFNQNLIRIVAEENHFPSLSKLGEKLALGQVLRGKVLDVFPGGKALADFNGQKLSIESGTHLSKGQEILAKVSQLKPYPFLKLIPPRPSTNSASLIVKQEISGEMLSVANRSSTKEFKGPISTLKNETMVGLNLKPGETFQASVTRTLDNGIIEVAYEGRIFPVRLESNTPTLKLGEEIILKVRQMGKGLYFEAPSFQFKGLDATALKPYLVAKEDFGTMTSNLEKNILKNPILKEVKIEPQLMDRLKETLRVLLPKDETLPDGIRLKEQVNRSGINYEGKVKRALLKELTPESRVTLARDLKGQLLELQGRVEKYLVKESANLPPASLKMVEGVSNQIKLAADNIELQQLSNQFARQEQQPILVQIPNPFSPETRTAKLYVKRDKEEGERGKEGKKDFNLVFILDMSFMGSLRVDAKVGERNVSTKIGVEQKDAIYFVEKNISRLKDRFQEMGYQAEVTCCIQEKEAMQMENGLEEILTRDPTRLIDIET